MMWWGSDTFSVCGGMGVRLDGVVQRSIRGLYGQDLVSGTRSERERERH